MATLPSKSKSKVKIVEATRVAPSPDSPKSGAELSLPLTFFDLFWFKLDPVERLFFYQFNDLTPQTFNSEVLPKLKHSLSAALLHFLPLAGHVKWSPDGRHPVISYTPGDGVSLTVAESDADFTLLSGNGIYEAVELHPLTPELISSDDYASAIALQVTLFPNAGFCIGIAAHHSVLDGKTTTLFIKAWAYLSNQVNNSALPEELTPWLDREVIKDPKGIDMIYLKQWLDKKGPSLKISRESVPSDLVRATVEISRQHFSKLRERVLDKSGKNQTELHLSTFVLTLAYIAASIVKARGGDASYGDSIFGIGFTIDCRQRLNPPIPDNYFGNCNTVTGDMFKAREFMGEEGFVFAAEKVSEMVKGLMEKGVLEGIEDRLSPVVSIDKESLKSIRFVSVAGSPRFEVYDSDFGWGKPLKVVVVSIEKNEAISMAESRDGSRGVEVGLALRRPDMENLLSFFLKDV